MCVSVLCSKFSCDVTAPTPPGCRSTYPRARGTPAHTFLIPYSVPAASVKLFWRLTHACNNLHHITSQLAILKKIEGLLNGRATEYKMLGGF